MANPISDVLTVNQVRDNLKQLREAALHRGVEVHFGERGQDEVVILSAVALAELKALAAGAARQRRSVAREREHRPQGFVAAMLSAGTFDGPPDLSENLDAYLHGDQTFPEA